MTEADDIKTVVQILKKVPPKKLRIVEILNEVPVVHGDLDINWLEKMGSEVEEAKEEAEDYKHATERAVAAILKLSGRDEWGE
jgi:hypothetical protein